MDDGEHNPNMKFRAISVDMIESPKNDQEKSDADFLYALSKEPDFNP